jgi:phosphoglycerol transferase MdoB-like AlkP superfamily enzyme
LLLSFIITIWTLKNIYFVYELQLSPHKKFILINSTLFISIIYLSLANFKNKTRLILFGIIYSSFSLLILSDVLYERYYDSILSVYNLSQSNQVFEIFDSIASLTRTKDILYILDIILVLILYKYLNFIELPRLKKHSVVLLIPLLAILITNTLFILKSNYSTQYRVALTGVVSTHIYDVHEYVLKKLESKKYANQKIKELEIHKKFFKEQQTKQTQVAHFGNFKDANLIMIQAESFNNFLVNLKINNQEITPNLNNLIRESNYYNNIFLQIGRGNTSDAEFVANNSLIPVAPSGIYKTYPKNNYLSLANVLKKNGYITSATHGNSPSFWNRQEAYITQGFETFYHIDHKRITKDEIIGMGISDKSIFEQMSKIYKGYNSPFYSFIVTLTHHRPFDLPKKYQKLKLPNEFKGTVTGNYLQSAFYFDSALGDFINILKEEGIWDNSIFVIYGDHYGPVPSDAPEIKKLINITFDQKEMFRVPLVIHHPNQKNGKVISKLGSQLDIYPTLTSLLGIDSPLLQLGESLDTEGEGFVGFQYETTKKSFYTDKYDYVASHDGIFENGVCSHNKTKKIVNNSYCLKGYKRIVKYVEISDFILSNNVALEIITK